MNARPRANNRRKQESPQGATAGLPSSALVFAENTAGQASSGTHCCNENLSPQAANRLMRRAGGYTLVELLVTITVIAIIAGFSLGGLFTAQEAARRDRTRAIVAKLHGQLMFRWETYETRRVPLVRLADEAPRGFAVRRLEALRELMRMELPQRWSDIVQPPIALTSRPALSEAYKRSYDGNIEPFTGQQRDPTALFQSAECLFLILSMGHDDALGTDRINMREVGDADQDGMKEFLDGWGNPIQFLRWAPGFLPVVDPSHEDEMAAPADPDQHPYDSSLPWPRAITDLHTGDPAHDPDPFDFRGIDMPIEGDDDMQRGYRLIPLIFSAGPDGKYDIQQGTATNEPVSNQPYRKLTENIAGTDYEVMRGTPIDVDDDESFDHEDNITNHRLDVSRKD